MMWARDPGARQKMAVCPLVAEVGVVVAGPVGCCFVCCYLTLLPFFLLIQRGSMIFEESFEMSTIQIFMLFERRGLKC